MNKLSLLICENKRSETKLQLVQRLMCDCIQFYLAAINTKLNNQLKYIYYGHRETCVYPDHGKNQKLELTDLRNDQVDITTRKDSFFLLTHFQPVDVVK